MSPILQIRNLKIREMMYTESKSLYQLVALRGLYRSLYSTAPSSNSCPVTKFLTLISELFCLPLSLTVIVSFLCVCNSKVKNPNHLPLNKKKNIIDVFNSKDMVMAAGRKQGR